MKEEREEMVEMARFLGEVFFLCTLPRTGWLLGGVRSPDPVSAHIYRGTTVASLLAYQEQADMEHCIAMFHYHDRGETRTLDMPPVTTRLLRSLGLSKKRIDRGAELYQEESLSPKFAGFLRELSREFMEGKTMEARCCRDADLIERGIIALLDRGNARFPQHLNNIIKEIAPLLKTESGKKLWAIIVENPQILAEWMAK
ncbi:MAG: HD domain-containing protein [Candidatus Wildermuthbacteria bacterium]|nr:HD domain-containing protein [Candidatus Wildermuthbacteria bacterium]